LRERRITGNGIFPSREGCAIMGLEDKKHRSHLPIATAERSGFMAYDAKDPDSNFPPIEQLRPPKGAPNA
jgi:hypothetical protein